MNKLTIISQTILNRVIVILVNSLNRAYQIKQMPYSNISDIANDQLKFTFTSCIYPAPNTLFTCVFPELQSPK